LAKRLDGWVIMSTRCGTTRVFSISLGCALPLIVGCSSSDEGTAPSGPAAGSAPVYSVLVEPNASSFSIRRDEVTLVRFAANGLELGRPPSVDDSTNYDPSLFVAGGAPPAGLEWVGVSKMTVESETSKRVVATLSFGDIAATLTIENSGPGRFDVSLVPESGAESVAYYRIGARGDSEEAFYGLGEYFDSVNHRGKVRAMQLELDATIESGYNEAHVPIPFVTGTRGWGLFVESRLPMAFDVASKEADLVEATIATGTASAAGLSFHVFAAEHPLGVTKHFYDTTGYPAKPARWALGPWVWRNENESQAQFENDLDTMRTLDLPTTAVWIDRPYATGVNTFDFDAQKFPDPQAMIRKAHDLGFRLALWHAPYLDQKDPNTQSLRDEATANGYYPPQNSILINNWGRPIDLTNPDAFAFWQRLIRRYTDLGVEGFKLDFAEDVTVGLPGVGRTVWTFSDGSDERTMHAGFQEFYHRVYAETLPTAGGFLLCRASTYGDQTRASVIWPGDLDANLAKHGDPAVDGGQPYVGGLPASIIAGLSLGPSGFPLFGADTGGYQHSPPDQETFMRWFEQTALSTVMQIGTGSSTVAWELTQNGYDQSELDAYRRYTRLHLRLFPYVWTYLERIAEDGRPIERALGLAYPELGEHPDDTYLFGDHLLVAPVTERGASSRDVSLPPGTWVDFWTGASHAGNRHITVSAPIDTLPLFVRAGGIVPMLRPTIDAIAETSAPGAVDSLATHAGVLYVRVAPGEKSDFIVYDGTHVSQEDSADELTLSSKSGDEYGEGILFEVIGWPAKPSSLVEAGAALTERADLASLEAESSGFAYDAALTGGTLWVKVPAGEHAVVVTK
jgi:alpha-D-xyloside xylohydrolase